MDCPVCKVPLTMSDRQGVEIDYCPRCRGVWLDRGEIDKIIEREVAAYGPLSQQDSAPGVHEPPFYRDDRPAEREGVRRDEYRGDRDDRRERDRDDYRRDRDDDSRHGDHRHKKRKRESFLEDLFDFG